MEGSRDADRNLLEDTEKKPHILRKDAFELEETEKIVFGKAGCSFH